MFSHLHPFYYENLLLKFFQDALQCPIQHYMKVETPHYVKINN
jgi:hypothetical protein